MPSDNIFPIESPSLNEDLPPRAQQSIYIGLSEKSKMRALTLAAVIAICNLAFAWYFAFKTEDILSLTNEDMKPFQMWVTSASGKTLSAESSYDLSARAMNLVSTMKLVSNKQALILTSFGGAFALLAIGFALFIIGADGAFKVIASSPAKASLAITGTAPGLLCFIISGWLIVSGVQHRSELEAPALPSNTMNVVNSMSTPTAPEQCDFKDIHTGKCP